MKDLEIIQESFAGSRLYGTNRPDSDVDVRGVCFSPLSNLLGLDGNFEQFEKKDPDTVIWELRKFTQLALANNPNILDTLFCPPEFWMKSSSDWEQLYHNRHSFLSQRVRKTYIGYAFSQLGRIQGHMKWIKNPPKEPNIDEFGAYDQSYPTSRGWMWKSQEHQQQYKSAHGEWTRYNEWLKNRNPARHELETKYGYDTKHAGHLVRLIVQADEILRYCTFTPHLTGKSLDMVYNVMHGLWSYESLLSFAKEELERLGNMHSPLPVKPDYDKISSLVQNMYINYIERNK